VTSMVTSMVGWRVSGDGFRPRRFGIVVWVWSAMKVADADEAGPCKDKVEGALREREKGSHSTASHVIESRDADFLRHPCTLRFGVRCLVIKEVDDDGSQ
jgi:hypothetical protein